MHAHKLKPAALHGSRTRMFALVEATAAHACMRLQLLRPVNAGISGPGGSPFCLQGISTVTSTNQEPCPPPKAIKLKDKGKRLEVIFSDGRVVHLSSEYLRVMSPSADTQDRRDAQGKARVVSGRRHVGILGVEPVGSYAIRLKFDDLHQAGIYSWDLLHDLGTNKWAHMRRYIQQLRSRGTSRSPPASRAAGGKAQGHCH